MPPVIIEGRVQWEEVHDVHTVRGLYNELHDALGHLDKRRVRVIIEVVPE